MEKNPAKKDLERSLKPAGSYLDSLSDFADFLGTIRQAENVAKELIEETSARPNTESAQHQEKQGTQNGNPDVGDKGGKAEPAHDLLHESQSDGHRSEPGASEAAPETDSAEKRLSLEELLGKLDELIGLEKIKQNVKSLKNYVEIRSLRVKEELPNPPLSLHMVFMGNPGTGKTTVARILAELYREIGVLSKGQLIEVDRSGLVAGYVGQTAIKTTEVVNSALGGILFIDEAYSLAPDVGSGNDFGRESIETLLKLMEDHRDDLIVIVAGYSEQMHRFIGSNPGLVSRFNRYFFFEDYNSDELFEIFRSMYEKSEYVLTEDAEAYARKYFQVIYDTRDENFGNARHVRNFFENIVSAHSDRVYALENHTRDDLTTVLREDLEKAEFM